MCTRLRLMGARSTTASRKKDFSTLSDAVRSILRQRQSRACTVRQRSLNTSHLVVKGPGLLAKRACGGI